MELISGTRVGLSEYPDMRGSVVMPEPEQQAPDVHMALVQWDDRPLLTWEYIEDLVTD